MLENETDDSEIVNFYGELIPMGEVRKIVASKNAELAAAAQPPPKSAPKAERDAFVVTKAVQINESLRAARDEKLAALRKRRDERADELAKQHGITPSRAAEMFVELRGMKEEIEQLAAEPLDGIACDEAVARKRKAKKADKLAKKIAKREAKRDAKIENRLRDRGPFATETARVLTKQEIERAFDAKTERLHAKRARALAKAMARVGAVFEQQAPGELEARAKLEAAKKELEVAALKHPIEDAFRMAVQRYQADHNCPSYESALVQGLAVDPQIRALYEARTAVLPTSEMLEAGAKLRHLERGQP